MRTDSVNLSTLCTNASKDEIIKVYGNGIQPATCLPHQLKGSTGSAPGYPSNIYERDNHRWNTARRRRLYELIWKRTLASQMADALIREDNNYHQYRQCRAKSSLLMAKLFLSMVSSRFIVSQLMMKTNAEDTTHLLPAMKEGDELQRREITATEKFSAGSCKIYRGQPRQETGRLRHRPIHQPMLQPSVPSSNVNTW